MHSAENTNNRTWVVLFFFILGVGVFIRVWTFGYKAFWVDEIHSLVYARNTVAHLTDIARTTDIHPPFYFLSLKAWSQLFGESREAARVFSILLGTASIGLVFLIARRLFDVSTALIAMAFFATFPTAVHYAREVRMYPLLTLLFLLSFFFFLSFLQSKNNITQAETTTRPIPQLLGFSTFLALAFYTHYTAAILFMLYTLVGVYSLIRGNHFTFRWLFMGLVLATLLVLPQLYHLFTSSLSNPDKDWMQATTFPVFYGITLGAYPYPALFKPVVLLVLLWGFGRLWQRDRMRAVILFLFTGGGTLIAAAIGIFEPIYLVRSIQVYTTFAALVVAIALIGLPRLPAIILGCCLIAANIYTTIQNEYIPNRVELFTEQTVPFVDMLDEAQDQIFVKNYLQSEVDLFRGALFEKAQAISHATLQTGITDITTQVERCLRSDATATNCRSVILIIEETSQFNVEAIATWNMLADDLKSEHAGHTEHLVAGYRVIVLSLDPAFLAKVDTLL